MRSSRWCATAFASLSWFGCAARPPTTASGIEPEDNSALIASATDPPSSSSQHDDHGFVQSRQPTGERPTDATQLPIHIQESWWPFRAQHLGISVEQAEKRDAQLSVARAPRDFWDSQTSLEAVSVWTVLCNECHGGRRSLDDAREMPEPAPAWGDGEGLFFGNRRAYEHMFNVVKNGGPVKEAGLAQMPAWRQILSTEMIWSLLYFLEYQSGGIESRFPPSLYPRRPKVLGEP